MKTGNSAKNGLYTGAAAGVVLFAVAGLLPGSFIGGIIGLNIASGIFGAPVAPSVIPRMIVGAFMVLGVMVSGVVFVTASSLAGWFMGALVDAVKYGKEADITSEVKAH